MITDSPRLFTLWGTGKKSPNNFIQTIDEIFPNLRYTELIEVPIITEAALHLASLLYDNNLGSSVYRSDSPSDSSDILMELTSTRTHARKSHYGYPFKDLRIDAVLSSPIVQRSCFNQ
jgi:hypothetical protein